jgi:hypothetical protein
MDQNILHWNLSISKQPKEPLKKLEKKRRDLDADTGIRYIDYFTQANKLISYGVKLISHKFVYL